MKKNKRTIWVWLTLKNEHTIRVIRKLYSQTNYIVFNTHKNYLLYSLGFNINTLKCYIIKKVLGSVCNENYVIELFYPFFNLLSEPAQHFPT